MFSRQPSDAVGWASAHRFALRNECRTIAEIGALREAVRETRLMRPFHVDAWVVLPDHLHCLWTLPASDADFPIRWQMIKARFSRRVGHPQERGAPLVRKREAGVWQRRFREHAIRDDADDAAPAAWPRVATQSQALPSEPHEDSSGCYYTGGKAKRIPPAS